MLLVNFKFKLVSNIYLLNFIDWWPQLDLVESRLKFYDGINGLDQQFTFYDVKVKSIWQCYKKKESIWQLKFIGVGHSDDRWREITVGKTLTLLNIFHFILEIFKSRHVSRRIILHEIQQIFMAKHKSVFYSQKKKCYDTKNLHNFCHDSQLAI